MLYEISTDFYGNINYFAPIGVEIDNKPENITTVDIPDDSPILRNSITDYSFLDGEFIPRYEAFKEVANLAKAEVDKLYEVNVEYFSEFIVGIKVDSNSSAVIYAMYFELDDYLKKRSDVAPIARNFAIAFGVSDGKMDDFFAEIFHKLRRYYSLIASLTAQRQQMYKTIDKCNDINALRSMQFIYYIPSESATRWG